MKIRVRAWHFEQKRMYSAEELAEDQMTLLPTGQFINVNSIDTKLSQIVPLDVMVPLLSTGLEDKNGKEIYDGDIILKKKYRLCVKWEERMENCGCCNKVYAFGFNFCFDEDLPFPPEQSVVIGNVYENPELIKEHK